MSSLASKQASEHGNTLFITQTDTQKEALARKVLEAFNAKCGDIDAPMRSVTLYLPYCGKEEHTFTFISSEMGYGYTDLMERSERIYSSGDILADRTLNISSHTKIIGVQSSDMYETAVSRLKELGFTKKEVFVYE